MRFCFTLALKNAGSEPEVIKTRLVVRGNSDRKKYNVVHDSTTLHKKSIKPTATIAAMCDLKLGTHYNTQGYLRLNSF